MEGGCRGKGTGEKHMTSLLVSLVKITSGASSNTPVHGCMNAPDLSVVGLCFGSVFLCAICNEAALVYYMSDLQKTDFLLHDTLTGIQQTNRAIVLYFPEWR